LNSPKSAQLEVLVRQYGRLISSVVRRVTGRAAELVGDDVEQRVLLSLWRQLENEQRIDHPSSYIYRIAVREAVRAIRQHLSRERRQVGEREAAAQPDQAADPSDGVVRREQREHIESSLGELRPDRERAVRAHLAGFAVREIMEMHAWPYEKARNLIARGMQDLRAALRRRGFHG
jgi:RNA polymerase sigma factor (sigma-70 family)